MTHDTRDLDAIADDILAPHAATQTRETQERARRRRTRSRTVGAAAGIIAICYAAFLLHRYLRNDAFDWTAVAIAAALVAAVVGIWRRP